MPVLTAIANHGRHKGAIFCGILATRADTVEAPRSLEIGATIRSPVKLVVIMVIIGDNFIARLDRHSGLAHVRKILASRDFRVGDAVM